MIGGLLASAMPAGCGLACVVGGAVRGPNTCAIVPLARVCTHRARAHGNALLGHQESAHEAECGLCAQLTHTNSKAAPNCGGALATTTTHDYR